MTKLKSKESRTIKNNNTDIDLDKILKEAENITLDSLDFNKTFKEQGKILCEIKYMLSKKNNNNDNKPFTCNPVISNKLNDTLFNELYQKFKQQNQPLSSKISTSSSGIKSSKKNKQNKLISKNCKSKASKTSMTCNTNNKKTTKYKLNTRYPIVIIKKRTPRKNVIYLNK
jgi:hypothetical protein